MVQGVGALGSRGNGRTEMEKLVQGRNKNRCRKGCTEPLKVLRVLPAMSLGSVPIPEIV
jgi:hypothetical protein